MKNKENNQAHEELGFAGCYVGGCVGDQCLASNTSGGVWFVWKTSGILNVLVELAK